MILPSRVLLFGDLVSMLPCHKLYFCLSFCGMCCTILRQGALCRFEVDPKCFGAVSPERAGIPGRMLFVNAVHPVFLRKHLFLRMGRGRMRQPHKILSIRESATREEIEEACRRKLIYLNPNAFEKGTQEYESAVKEMYHVRRAYTAMMQSLDQRAPV